MLADIKITMAELKEANGQSQQIAQSAIKNALGVAVQNRNEYPADARELFDVASKASEELAIKYHGVSAAQAAAGTAALRSKYFGA